MFCKRRRGLVVTLITALLSLVFLAPPAQAQDDPSALTATWMAGKVQPDGRFAPWGDTGNPAPDDWGLAIDFMWALNATSPQSAAEARIVSAVSVSGREYWSPAAFNDPDARIAGATAKSLVAALVAREDPKSFQGTNMRSEVLSLIAPSGVEKGRIKDRLTAYPTYDSTNTFSQSLAVIGLAGSGGVPQSTVDFLVKQQCKQGYFRMFYNDKLSCDRGKGKPDGDGTAMALSALLAAKEAGAKDTARPIAKAVRWLKSAQKPDGSFGGGVTTEGANTNSTGLIAQALADAGETKAARKAGRWIATLQITPENSRGLPIEREIGAIAYNQDAFDLAVQGQTNADSGQWRRATAQAVFGLKPVSFRQLVGLKK